MFDIFFNEIVMGQAEMIKEGLYYKIHCTCSLPNSGIHRIIINDGETVRDLGICVPVGDKFVLKARVPAKTIKGDKLEFHLVAGKKSGIPVAAGMPFSALDQLETARLQVTNGQSEIIIDSAQDPQDSGQNPEHLQISESP